jgi:thioredoxin reductase (NADPH)
VERVTLLVRGGELKASQILQDKVLAHPRVDVRFHTEVVAFHGARSKLESVTIKNKQSGATEELAPAGVFVFIGLTPNSGFLSKAGVRLNRWGFIVTGHDLTHDGGLPPGYEARSPAALETSIPGVFAAGDVRLGSSKQVASAAGEGVTAALLIREYLKTV